MDDYAATIRTRPFVDFTPDSYRPVGQTTPGNVLRLQAGEPYVAYVGGARVAYSPDVMALPIAQRQAYLETQGEQLLSPHVLEERLPDVTTPAVQPRMAFQQAHPASDITEQTLRDLDKELGKSPTWNPYQQLDGVPVGQQQEAAIRLLKGPKPVTDSMIRHAAKMVEQGTLDRATAQKIATYQVDRDTAQSLMEQATVKAGGPSQMDAVLNPPAVDPSAPAAVQDGTSATTGQ